MTRIGWFIGLLLLTGTCHATRVQRLSLDDIRDQASSIIISQVTFEETRLGPNAKMVWTDYELAVEDVLQGVDQPEFITLSFAGGKANGKDIGIMAVPRLEVGRRYVLFLLQDETPWVTPTVGWGQGIFEIVPQRSNDESTGDETEVLVSYDGEPLEITPTGLRRGSIVTRTKHGIEIPEVRDPLRFPRESEPVVLNADGNEISQPPQIPDPAAIPLEQRSFATLDQLRKFLLGEIREDTGEPN